MHAMGAMTNALAPLLALMLAVTPTVDVVCRALCTASPVGAAAPSCHEGAAPTADGVLPPAIACHHDAAEAVNQSEGARNRLVVAPLGTVQVTIFAYLPSPAGGGDRKRQSVRPRLPHAYPSTVVLRV